MQGLLDGRLPTLRYDPAAAPVVQFSHSPDDIFLEIGFGGGENLAAVAAARPDAGFIGAEPFINGVASLLRHIEDQALSNIRIWDDDVRLILAGMPEACLAGAYVLFPDPEVASHVGEVMWMMGREEQAKEVWRGALENQPDSELIQEVVERLQVEL